MQKKNRKKSKNQNINFSEINNFLLKKWAPFPSPPHFTQTWILWSDEWFCKVNYED